MRAQIEPSIELGPREGLIAIARAYYSAMRSRADLIRNLAANSSQDPELARAVMSEIIGQGAPLMVAWFALQIEKGALRPIDPALLIQGLFGPVFLLIVLGPAVFDELARIGIHPAIDDVEAYVDLLLHGAAQPDSIAGGYSMAVTPTPPPPAAARRRRSRRSPCARTSARSTRSTVSTWRFRPAGSTACSARTDPARRR